MNFKIILDTIQHIQYNVNRLKIMLIKVHKVIEELEHRDYPDKNMVFKNQI